MKYIYYLLIIITTGLNLPLEAAVVKAPVKVSCEAELRKSYRSLNKRRVPHIPPKDQCKVENKLITWLWLLKKNSHASFQEHVQFIKENPTWPELKKVKEHAELAIKNKVNIHEILDYFNVYAPVSPPGAIQYARALIKTGKKDQAIKIIRKWWRDKNFSAKTEREFYKSFKSYLKNDDYKARLDRLIVEGNYYGMQRMKPRVNKNSQKLIEAAIALSRNLRNVNIKIKTLSKKDELHSGIAYQRVRWRLRRKKYDSAYELFQEAEKAGTTKQFPEKWFKYRYYFARKQFEEKKYAKAYEIVRRHGLTSKLHDIADYAAAEWFSGWLGLMYLNKPEKALEHFKNMYNAVETPISQSKGAYWIARAFKKLKDEKSSYTWMNESAKNPHVFYGQMALNALDRPSEIKIHDTAQDPDLPSKNDKMVMDGIRALARIDPKSKRLRKMLFDLSKYSENMIAEAIVELAVEIGKPEWAVIIAKIAGRRDPPLVKAAYPLKKLPSRVLKWDYVDPVFIYSLIRQESGFNTKAKSHAGARGLMQIMPRTARLLSRKLRLKYTLRKLTADPTYNMILGCYYVSQLMKGFNGSKVRTLAGYNAGESRVRKWVKLFGTPGEGADIIDWIESIPFSETRSYVMRVMESYPVYKKLLADQNSKK